MQHIIDLLNYLVDHSTEITVVISFLIRFIERWLMKNKHKKEIHTAYSNALASALQQLKNNGVDVSSVSKKKPS